MKRFYRSIVVLSLIVTGLAGLGLLYSNNNAQAAMRRDCDDNAIIRCGAANDGELAQRYNENKPGDLPAVYQNYGLSAADVTRADAVAKMGEVRKDGTVVVGGETVATNASSIGRQNIFSGSTTKNIGGKTYYDTPPSRSFASQSITAFVFFDKNGQFKAAILASCGNPVNAVPKPKPPKPQTPPTPPVKPQSKYSCDNLTVKQIGRTQFSFDTKYTIQNVTFKSLEYVIRDKNGVEIQRTANNIYTQEQPGAYSVEVIVTVIADNKDVVAPGKNCRAPFEVAMPQECKPGIPVGDDRCKEQPPKECKPGIPQGDDRCTPCPIPGKEQYAKNDTVNCQQPPVELPHTGPMDFIGGGIGIGSIIAAGYYWYTSRRDLLSTLLNR